jgi:hypothetical protein
MAMSWAHRGALEGRAIGLIACTPFVTLLLREWYLGLSNPNSYLWYLFGIDYRLHIDATARYFSGGSFYFPWQLAGPYGLDGPLPILYPPEAMALFAPFLVLPAFLWWALPLLVTLAVVVYWRPRPVAWPLIAACLWWPLTSIKIVAGNPEIWITMFIALGTLYRWPSALVVWKPTLAPFALVGYKDRRWWVLLVIALIPFCWLFPEYITAMHNFVGSPFRLLYSVPEIPMLLIPLIAWKARGAGFASTPGSRSPAYETNDGIGDVIGSA